MIDSGTKCNHQLAFELQNSHVCEKRSKMLWCDCVQFESTCSAQRKVKLAPFPCVCAFIISSETI